LVITNNYNIIFIWWFAYFGARVCSGSICVHSFLDVIILGISCYYHDSSSCLIKNGEILAASQEERFTRIKHDSNFPIESIKSNLKINNLEAKDIDYVIFYEKPFIKFERILETYLNFIPWGFKNFSTSMPVWIKDKIFQKKNLIDELNGLDKKILWKDKIFFSNHHLSHASSAFFPSKFEKAIILTMDGVGEWSTSSVHIGDKNQIIPYQEINFPDSLGLLYSAFTYFLGFKVNSGEYKVMGLAPYGEPKYVDQIKNFLIDIKPDGSFKMNMQYFEYCNGLKMTNKKFNKLFGIKNRNPEETIKQIHMDIASSIQKICEEVIIKICKHLREKLKIDNLCLAGGVALNCVANGIIQKQKIFKNIWVQPASGDAGGALGAALALYYLGFENDRKVEKNDQMKGSYLGPSYEPDEIKKELQNVGANFKFLEKKLLIKKISEELANEKIVGWFNGRMEYGPRALGSRSIIADPRSKNMQKNLNLKIKYRESFRPFAPSILIEDLENWFDLNTESPYMLMVGYLKNKNKINNFIEDKTSKGFDKLRNINSKVPSVSHVDLSSRIQTVNGEYNEDFYDLIKSFKEKTGCPILINTSFNIRGEPIVCTPHDAFKCFMGTDLDILVIENYILYKQNQNPELKIDLKKEYELD
jgi:carbamoyltransferase